MDQPQGPRLLLSRRGKRGAAALPAEDAAGRGGALREAAESSQGEGGQGVCPHPRWWAGGAAEEKHGVADECVREGKALSLPALTAAGCWVPSCSCPCPRHRTPARVPTSIYNRTSSLTDASIGATAPAAAPASS